MNKFQLLKNFLPGLLPLIAFILIDEIYGTTAGLVVAVSIGVVQLIYIYIKDKVFDKFTFFDTLLIIILGAVSFVLDNDIFFKLKPAIIGVIFCLLLGVSAFSKLNVIALMSKRYFREMKINDEQIRQFNKSLKVLFFIFLFHTFLVFYSAFFMSKEAWAFISTALFYILFGVYFAFEMIKNKIKSSKYKKEVWLPIIDEKGNVTGKAPYSVVHQNKDLMHPVIHLHVINSKKQIFLQKRKVTQLINPGKWDIAVSGHVAADENIDVTLERRAKEVMGIHDPGAVLIGHYPAKTDTESELVFMFYTKRADTINLNPDEAVDGRFWGKTEIAGNLGKNIFTPAFEFEFSILKKKLII